MSNIVLKPNNIILNYFHYSSHIEIEETIRIFYIVDVAEKQLVTKRDQPLFTNNTSFHRPYCTICLSHICFWFVLICFYYFIHLYIFWFKSVLLKLINWREKNINIEIIHWEGKQLWIQFLRFKLQYTYIYIYIESFVYRRQ